MASERQIAANCRNARKSTGPRSTAGKKRAGGNAYRHGLNVSMSSNAAFAKELDRLVREIAGDTKNAIMLERARAVAEAELDVARVRRAKVALIERASAFGEPDPRSADAVRRVLPDLRKLNRYERRAAVRRDQAVRALWVELKQEDNQRLYRCKTKPIFIKLLRYL